MGHRTLQLDNHNRNCASDLLPEIKNECVSAHVRAHACVFTRSRARVGTQHGSRVTAGDCWKGKHYQSDTNY